MARITKARYWWSVLYPDSMTEDWQNRISDEIQLPYAYCIHNADIDSAGENRKEHVHLILAFTNTTTYKHALEVFNLLGKVNNCKAIIDIRSAYNYLIHDTEACRNAQKHTYEPFERICGNGFDIGAYEQIGIAEKQEMLFELKNFIIDNEIINMTDFLVAVDKNFSKSYWQIIVANSAFLERIIKGNYFKLQSD